MPDDRINRVLAQFVAALRRQFGERLFTVALFGSRARGDDRPDSDIDLLIVCRRLPRGEGGLSEELRALENEAEERLVELYGLRSSPRLSVIAKTPEDAVHHSPIYLDMVEDARLLHDRDGFFENVLGEVRANMARLGSKRVRLPGGWYWDLKPDYRFGETFEI